MSSIPKSGSRVSGVRREWRLVKRRERWSGKSSTPIQSLNQSPASVGVHDFYSRAVLLGLDEDAATFATTQEHDALRSDSPGWPSQTVLA
jgi:hypothetical protein